MSVNPLNQKATKQCKSAAKTLRKFTNPNKDCYIPRPLLRNARGIVVIQSARPAALLSLKGGVGVGCTKLPNGRWSGPACFATGGGGVGWQVGVEMIESVFVMMSAEVTVDMIANHHPVGTAGGSLAVGPLSDEFEAEMIFEGPATMTFSDCFGLFIGVNFEGVTFAARATLNDKYYKSKVTAKQILRGEVDLPEEWEENPLHVALKEICGETPLSQLPRYVVRQATELEKSGVWAETADQIRKKRDLEKKQQSTDSVNEKADFSSQIEEETKSTDE